MTLNPHKLSHDAWIAVLNSQQTIAAALGMTVPAIQEAVSQYRKRREMGDRSPRNGCAFTTTNGTACSYIAHNQVDNYMWACQHHRDKLIRTIPHLIEHLPAGEIADIAQALAERIRGDEWARSVTDRYLTDHFDKMLTERLHAKWGA